MTNRYDDIINSPAPVSKYHAHMSMHDRAAQFAPFAALTGYDDEVDEVSRLTETKTELTDDEIDYINLCLSQIRLDITNHPEISVIYFVPDELKCGGKYIKKTGTIKKIDEYTMFITFDDMTSIPIDDILSIEIVRKTE